MQGPFAESVDVVHGDALSHALTWSLCAGKRYVTIVVKASFAYDGGGALSPRPPAPVVVRDVHVGGDPRRSLVASVESAPYLPGCAVLVSGIAHPTRAAARDPFAVRLGLSGRAPMIDKTLRVEDRTGQGVALSYENAPRDGDNPFGSAQPAIVDPRNPDRSAGFGPLPPFARSRTQYLRAAPPVFSDLLDLGREFDSRFWNPAPTDQQTPFLRGGETIFLEGLHAAERTVRIELPRLDVSARYQSDEAAFQPIAMSADMLTVDTNQRSLSILWRAIVTVAPSARNLRFEARWVGEPIQTARVLRERSPEARSTEPSTPPGLSGLPFKAPPSVFDAPMKAKNPLAETAPAESRPVKGPALPFEAGTPAPPRSRPLVAATPFDPRFVAETTPTSHSPSTRPIQTQKAPPPIQVLRAAPETHESAAGQPLAYRPPVAEAAGGGEAAVPAAATSAPHVQSPHVEPAAPPESAEALEPKRAAVLARVRAGGTLSDLDLVGADLAGVDLAGANLSDAKLDGACLDGANLRGARLARASMVGASLENARCDGADLEGAKLGQAKLRASSFVDALLNHADLSGASGESVVFTRARMKRARLVGAILPRAMFDGADLEETTFTKANLRSASFKGASLDRAGMSQADAEKASFEGARLDDGVFARATLVEARFDDAEGARVSFEGACAVKATFLRAKLRNATFEKASLDEARFDEADLSSASLVQCAAPGARFADAQLTECNFRQASLEAAGFSRAKLARANLARANLTRALFDAADLTDVDARNARLGHAKLNGANLSGTDLRDADLSHAVLTGAEKATAKLKGAKLKDVVE